jgi:hypothetical protein
MSYEDYRAIVLADNPPLPPRDAPESSIGTVPACEREAGENETHIGKMFYSHSAHCADDEMDTSDADSTPQVAVNAEGIMMKLKGASVIRKLN